MPLSPTKLKFVDARCFYAAVFLIIAQILFATSLRAQSSELPNIVLMMADDMGMGDTSAYQDITGNSDTMQIFTPHMDALARTGIRFTDAHTPTSRCSGTRYGLMTGRYPWRNRLKHWVLFGAQGDPMIESDRPTIATLLKDNGYRTGMVGKWHIGLRYRQSNGKPADAWKDADLTKPLYDTPLDHGFDYCRFTSRSHGTSGVSTGKKSTKNGANQSVGPGHIHGRTAVSATGDGKRLKPDDDPDAYLLNKLGSRHTDHAISFLNECVSGETKTNPFFLYFASNSNHGPYTPESKIAGKPVKGASRNVAGDVMPAWKNGKSKQPSPKIDLRHDYIYENDVILGTLVDYLQSTDDPRRPGRPLIENTIVIFTSDNGAERKATYATGPFRSNKGSAYEGGHRVPLIVSWPIGDVGDGDAETKGQDSSVLIGLQDMFATFSEIVGAKMPTLQTGAKGGEDSTSMLAALRGESILHGPLFHNDHNAAKDHAATAFRHDDPTVAGKIAVGKWKLFFDANLIRKGTAAPTELYELASDPQEENDRLNDPKLQSLIAELTRLALLHRNSGGHRNVLFAPSNRTTLNWMASDSPLENTIDLRPQFADSQDCRVSVDLNVARRALRMNLTAVRRDEVIANQKFHINERGLGISGGNVHQVDSGEGITITFDQDVLVESAAIVAGNGHAGGFYRVGEASPLAIYCVDDDIDANDQSGVISDIGVLPAGHVLRFDSRPHFGVEATGQWRLGSLTIRLLTDTQK